MSNLTVKQEEALDAMRSCLVCQLCDKRMTEPATLLSCAHSFCYDCILEYTENSWTCPLPGCGHPVTMKGGSRESIKKNHVLSAVSASLENIEKILTTAPTNWWLGRNDDKEQDSSIHSKGEQTEEVDFQVIMDQVGSKRKADGRYPEETDDCGRSLNRGGRLSSDNASSDQEENNSATKVRKTLSLDQSLFSDSRSFNQNMFSGSTHSRIGSLSPIAMLSSQPEPNSPMPSIGEGSAVAGHTNAVLMPCAQTCATRKTSPGFSKASPQREQRASPSTTPLNQLSAGKKTPQPPGRHQKPRVSFQQQPIVMLLNPSWTLSNQDTRCLRTCINDGLFSILKIDSNHDLYDTEDQFDSRFEFETEEARSSFLALLSSSRKIHAPPAPLSFYAISTERDLSFSFAGEVITVPRSFPYYLAVACGLPIVDIGLLTSVTKLKRRGTTRYQRYLFPSLTHSTSKVMDENSSQADYVVRGASNYSWDAPEKARTAALLRHSLWQKGEGPHASSENLLPGCNLLDGYRVLLLGEFDQLNQRKRPIVSKRKKKQGSEEKGGGYCTRGNMILLLQLCGANVYDVDSIAVSTQVKRGLTTKQIIGIKNLMPLGGLEDGTTLVDALQTGSKEVSCTDNVVVMVKDLSDSKLASEFFSQMSPLLNVNSHPLVTCQWLLDSIGDFEVKNASGCNCEGV